MTAQPRFIMRCAATGESIPPDSRQVTRPAVPVGSPPGATFLAEEVERLVGQQLDVDRPARRHRDRRVQPRASLMRPPISRSTCGDVIGNRLSARRRRHAKARARAIAEVRREWRAQSRRGRRAVRTARNENSSRCREVRMPNTRDRPLTSAAAPARARISIAAHQRAHVDARRDPTGRARRLRTSRPRNHGRFFPLSAIS